MPAPNLFVAFDAERFTLNDQRELESSLGKIYSYLGDAAFRHYRAGNDPLRSVLAANSSTYTLEADRLIGLLTRDQIGKSPVGSRSELPIVIVGAPRSGITLADALLRAHANVGSAGESPFCSRTAKSIMEAFPKSYSLKTASNTAEQYLAPLRAHSAAPKHVVDKMPENFRYLGLIHSILPNAKIFHCVRNPVDTCLSLCFQNPSDAHRNKWDLIGPLSDLLEA